MENENGKDISLTVASACQEKVLHELTKLWCGRAFKSNKVMSDITILDIHVLSNFTIEHLKVISSSLLSFEQQLLLTHAQLWYVFL